MTTITFSVPDAMYEDAKKMLIEKHYASVSAFARDGFKKLLYKKKLTINGFTEEFEDEVLRTAADPVGEGTILETDEDIDNYFLRSKKSKIINN